MKQYLKYDLQNFLIEQTSFDANFTAKTESMMALGNGYLGLRAVDEEVESFNKEGFFVNGIFNNETREEVTEMANLADLIQTPIYLDGQRLTLTPKDSYSKHIDIKRGLLKREIIVKRKKKSFKLVFLRFVSQANQHLYAQKIKIFQLHGQATILNIFPRVNGQTHNYGAQHLKEGTKKRTSPTSVQYLEETTNSRRTIIHNLFINAFVGNKKLHEDDNNFIITMNRRQVGFKITTPLNSKTPFTIEKLMTVNTSIDNAQGNVGLDEVVKQAIKLHNGITTSSFDQEFRKSCRSWQAIWNQFDVNIIGESEDAKYDHLAFTFAIFHLNAFVPKNNSNLSVGAKGLSGEGYQGHTFWDTEIFINPTYLFTKPSIARNLLEYRYKGIAGARAKAQVQKVRKEESNLIGAQYPWETAWPADGEVCPYWNQAGVAAGQQVPIASYRQEIHVAADIAYAIHQYYVVTNDHQFMADMGYEMIIDTAIFWAKRAEKQDGGQFEIKDVMGPNEYKGNIDNSAYTNELAIKNLKLAIRYIKELNQSGSGQLILQKVNSKIPYSYSIDEFQEVASKLKQQLPNEAGIIAENDQFLSLKRVDVTPFQLLGDAGNKLFNTFAGHERLASQVVKQADVVLLTYLLPEQYSKMIIKKNFEFYEPITTHDSSLSPATYAIQAIELRKMALGYKLFKYALNIDMGPNMQSCDQGIHAGSIATIWQAIIFGYGGMRYTGDSIHFNPVLPEQWTGLEYSIIYKGSIIKVSINREKFIIQSTNAVPVRVFVLGKEVILCGDKQEFGVQSEY